MWGAAAGRETTGRPATGREIHEDDEDEDDYDDDDEDDDDNGNDVQPSGITVAFVCTSLVTLCAVLFLCTVLFLSLTMAPKAKAKSVRAARAKALAEAARVVRANARKKCRRNTLNELNILGAEAGIQTMSFDAASDKKVASFVRQLARRSGSDFGK